MSSDTEFLNWRLSSGPALQRAIRAITVDKLDDSPNGPAERALDDLVCALSPDIWHESDAARVLLAREAAARMCEAMADDTKRLREAAEAFFGGDFRAPPDDPSGQ